MTDDPIDQALRDERQITPSPDFAHRVMRSVRNKADDQGALPFPWKPLAGGLAAAAGLAIVGALTGEAAPALPPPDGLAVAAPILAWLATTLVASGGLAWWSIRFAGR